MAVINVLDQETINQIAAGEVVERPASIVKELVENAIDAFSTAITVEIKGGGIDFLRITDNGSGIEKDQIRNAFLPHATSKIRSARDLETVGSLGFRGEALASISAVTKLELITKTDEGISGIRYVAEGGRELLFEEIGCPEGTTFIVRNLFFNTPARRKFLKSKMTESGYVEAFMQRLALSRPDIAFKFICDNKNKISTSGNGNIKDVIYHIFGRDVAMNLLETDREDNGIRVHGYVGKPVISRGNRNFEYYYVNGRYLRNNIIARAIEEGYKGHAMVHKFPFVVLMIDMDPHAVDVNVHPQKMEMRFNNGEDLYTALVSAVRASFVKKELIPDVRLGRDKKKDKKDLGPRAEPFEKKRRQIEERFAGLSPEKIEAINRAKTGGGPDGPAGTDSPETDSGQAARAREQRERLERQMSLLQSREIPESVREIDAVMGQVREEGSYGVSGPENRPGPGPADRLGPGSGDKLTKTAVSPLVEVRTGSGEGNVSTGEKADLEPENQPLSGSQMTFADVPVLSDQARSRHRIIGQVFRTYWLIEYDGRLLFVDQHAAHEKVMYEKFLKDLENREIHQQMIAPPVVLTFSLREKELYLQCQEAFRELGFLIEEFGGNEYCIRGMPANLLDIDPQELFVDLLDQMEENGGRLVMDRLTDRLASMACKAAVKGNMTMTEAEMDSLMDQLLKLDNPYQCPHGRPTIISMSQRELEKKFKRIQ